MSEYERLLHERRRTHDAKREARTLRGGAPSVHPWIEVAQSQRAREQRSHTASPAGRPRATWKIVGLLAFLAVAGAAFIGAARTPPESPAGAPARVKLWHALGAADASLLEGYSQQSVGAGSTIESIELVVQENLEQSLRIALLRGDAPDIASVTATAARTLASTRVTQPFATAQADEDAQAYIPLGASAPWTEPLVAVRLRTELPPDAEVALTLLVTGLATEIDKRLLR